MFTLLRTPLWRPFRRLAKDARGVSAVEFALILPLMLTLYLGGNELTHALTVARKVTHLTSSLGDLVTQTKAVSTADMTKIYDVVGSILTPYPITAGLLRIRVSGIRIDAGGIAKVAWGSAFQDTPLTVGAPFTLPAGVAVASTFIVTAEVHYAYKPVIGYALTGTFDLQDQFYLRPRLSTEVAFN